MVDCWTVLQLLRLLAVVATVSAVLLVTMAAAVAATIAVEFVTVPLWFAFKCDLASTSW